MSYEVHSRNVGLSVQSIELDERHPEKQAINSIAKNFATKFFAILKYLNNRHLLCKKRNINTAFRISYFVSFLVCDTEDIHGVATLVATALRGDDHPLSVAGDIKPHGIGVAGDACHGLHPSCVDHTYLRGGIASLRETSRCHKINLT